MCAVGRSSLFLNARVHLPGSKGRAAACRGGIEYVATRPGANAQATPGDERRAELAARMGLAGYYAERPGSTALFDADGAVPLSEARRRLAAADGALSTLVISVRREEANELRLNSKEDWERFCRRELAPALATMMDIPESDVRWMAAQHENSPSSKHVHVFAYSESGSFSTLMRKPDLDRARSSLTDSALAPAIKAAMAARDIAREQAVGAVRSVRKEEVELSLPESGRVSYAHLHRWHPEAARKVIAELERLGSERADIVTSRDAFELTVARCAELGGLEGEEAERYIRDALKELDARRANALIRVVAPDRTAGPALRCGGAPVPASGPAATRRVLTGLESEAAACVSAKGARAITNARQEGHPVPVSALKACPTFSRALSVAPTVATEALAAACQTGGSCADIGEDAAKVAARCLLAVARAVGLGRPAEAVARIASTMERSVRI